jgi:ABC-2 type transport system ATP-binding protein
VSAPVVRVDNLTKVYRSRSESVVAVDHVSFRVEPGEIVGLLGPNGAGKTTTIKCLCTLVRPTSGTVALGQVDVVAHPARALENVTAVLEGNRNIYWRLSPRENLEFFSGLQGISTRSVRPYINELIDRFALGDKRDVAARKLSRGMQQKLAVACALVKRTEVLLLDEPTLGLDVETSHELRSALVALARDDGRTIVLSSHDMNVVQDICERVIIIHEGRVVTDDRVANLLQVFRARAYRIRLEGAISDAQARALHERFDIVHTRAEDGGTDIEVELFARDQMYDLMDVLRAGGSVIESIDREEPNLEEVFLSIVRKRA